LRISGTQYLEEYKRALPLVRWLTEWALQGLNLLIEYAIDGLIDNAVEQAKGCSGLLTCSGIPERRASKAKLNGWAFDGWAEEIMRTQRPHAWDLEQA
jgi:hypothetical protein